VAIAVADFIIVPDHRSVGEGATATVTLNRAADPGGQAVVLSTANRDIATIEPLTLTVPAGQTTARAEVRCSSDVPSGFQKTIVILEAKIGGVGKAWGIQCEPKN